VIPASRIDSAATIFCRFAEAEFWQHRYIANAGTFDKTYEYLGRVDHQLTNNQRIMDASFICHEPTNQVDILLIQKLWNNICTKVVWH